MIPPPIDPSDPRIYWTLSKAVVEQRENISAGWTKLMKLVVRKKTKIAFTGIEGSGKTVLMDHLTGAAFKEGYTLPDKSREIEKGKIRKKRKRLDVVVIPGQESYVHLDALDDLKIPKNMPDGIVHVVCHGHITHRNPTALEAHRQKFQDFDQFQQDYVKEEFRGLEEICEFVRELQRKHRKPRWLLLAVAKADLFHKDLHSAEALYSRASAGLFSNRVDRLLNQVGSDNLDWIAAPVCSSLQPLDWGGGIINPQINEASRDKFLISFTNLLTSLCHE